MKRLFPGEAQLRLEVCDSLGKERVTIKALDYSQVRQNLDCIMEKWIESEEQKHKKTNSKTDF